MPKIRILIVDDAVVVRRLLTHCLASDPDLEVVGTASNGQIGLARLSEASPDVVTLDLEMPVMGGLQTLAAIRKTHPRLPVIILSTLTERGAATTLDALAMGASDYVTKPANSGSMTAAMQRIREELIPKIKALCGHLSTPGAAAGMVAPRLSFAPGRGPGGWARRYLPPISTPAPGVGIVAIGASTGGPNALAALLQGLARDLPVPIVIVQHMPALFTRLLAERLTAVSGFPVREAVSGARLEAGEIWIATGGFHLEVEKTPLGVVLRTHEGPPENSCRPAVDVLFRSVARAYGPRALGLVLTGMGHDGLRGCELIREEGGRVLTQDEGTSVIWGMPGAVTRAGLAEKTLPLHELAAEINRLVRAGHGGATAPGLAVPAARIPLPKAS